MSLTKSERRQRIQYRIRKIVSGTAARPRLSVFRSHKHIYAQLIDDKNSTTLAFSSTLDADVKKLITSTATLEASKIVGENIAQKARLKNIETVVFDRGDRPYHGRIKNVAEGARKEGLIF